MTPTDTIVAVATPAGRGGVGIVRLSGPDTRGIGAKILNRSLPPPRRAVFRTFLDADDSAIDEGLAIFFQAPHSFTGEDVLELQGHGGPVVLDMLLRRCIELGARLARPGEFSERAFLNDKLDLAQAEAIADLIDSGSERAARSALKSLRGEFSARINDLVDRLIDLRLHIEAALDFPEEEIDFLSDSIIHDKLASVKTALETVFRQARHGELLREGLTLVIVGQPNAGKSSLMNRFVGRDAAIVTPIPGTTRDVLREYIQIDGLPLHILDTAGLRESE
ncbi:MAG TPA: tRNA uridine-5-carboxymethylaminomethyl(34) synthesis GTPase MnmE, partial [Gammaproteobacteria bacterium]|nr:tRNA uridine-5-carboxymethylaminomethyl(34) synthesis GTPase MnmE [Gammaproteobacteria bacterium]